MGSPPRGRRRGSPPGCSPARVRLLGVFRHFLGFLGRILTRLLAFVYFLRFRGGFFVGRLVPLVLGGRYLAAVRGGLRLAPKEGRGGDGADSQGQEQYDHDADDHHRLRATAEVCVLGLVGSHAPQKLSAGLTALPQRVQYR